MSLRSGHKHSKSQKALGKQEKLTSTSNKGTSRVQQALVTKEPSPALCVPAKCVQATPTTTIGTKAKEAALAVTKSSSASVSHTATATTTATAGSAAATAVAAVSTTQAHSCHPQAQQFIPASSSTSSTSFDLKFYALSSSPRTLRNSMRRGRSIKPQRVPETSLVGSVAGFVYDAMPQSSSSGQGSNERIEWVNMQKYSNATDPEKSMDIVVFGLTRGFQIWAILENGECEEIVTERQGPLKIGRLLTCNPLPCFGVTEDKFENYRPLFAVVDANSPVDRPCSTLSFISLVCRQHIHHITFPNQICTFEESSKALVVSFTNRLVICDALSLREQRYVYYPNGPTANNVFTISDIFLSFADPTFSQCWQSCGGMMSENDSLLADQSSYASSVVNAASSLTKAFSAWGESVVSSFSSSPQPKNPLVSSENLGIVTVLDITKLPVSGDHIVVGDEEDDDDISNEVNDNEINDGSYSIIAHFIAHNEPIGYLKFGNGGRILLTSGQSSTCFHVFLLHPHPGSSALAAAQHIYTLNRGNTPAKVVGCTFSMDNRFVAVATNHGTTHLFAICPYGGPVSMRTHGSKLVNKESRYHRSAGLDNSDIVPINEPIDFRNYQFGAPQIYKDHPSLARPSIARSARNPRIGPYVNPIGLFASAKLRDSLSVDNLSAWASDIAAPLTTARKRATSGSKNVEQSRISVLFASNFIFSDKPALLIAGTDGLVTEYVIDVLPKEISSAPDVDVLALSRTSSNWQVPIKCELHGYVYWQLQRGTITDMRLPLSERNPFLVWLKSPRFIDRKESLDDKTEAWMSQIEVFTYSEPYRRLFKVPQFQFITLQSDVQPIDLVAPGKSKSKKNVKAVPVVIEAAGSLSRSYDFYESIYGGSEDEKYDTMIETLKDAMKDTDIDRVEKSSNEKEAFEYISSRNSSSSSEKYSRSSAECDSINLPLGALDP